jgi:hypothetical protein
MNPILHSSSNRTMEKQMIDSFPSLLAHATLGFDKNLKYLPLPKVINSQNFPQSCSPKEKVHLSLDFRLPQTIPQEVKLGWRLRECIIGFYFERLPWRRSPTKVINSILSHRTRIKELHKGYHWFQLPILNCFDKMDVLVTGFPRNEQMICY